MRCCAESSAGDLSGFGCFDAETRRTRRTQRATIGDSRLARKPHEYFMRNRECCSLRLRVKKHTLEYYMTLGARSETR